MHPGVFIPWTQSKTEFTYIQDVVCPSVSAYASVFSCSFVITMCSLLHVFLFKLIDFSLLQALCLWQTTFQYICVKLWALFMQYIKLRISDQNGVSWLNIFVEMYLSGRKPSKYCASFESYSHTFQFTFLLLFCENLFSLASFCDLELCLRPQGPQVRAVCCLKYSVSVRVQFCSETVAGLNIISSK